MLFDDTYQTIAQATNSKFTDRGSKFLGYAFPINTETDVKEKLLLVKKEHPSATHHCYAYRLGLDKTAFRVNDDGEPTGSAGRPILNQLLSKNITNVLVIVVRYYGGTMLGIPGLINAYKTATQEALEQATISTNTVNDTYKLTFDYIHMNDVMRVLKEENLTPQQQQFDTHCAIVIAIRQSAVNRSMAKLTAITSIKATYIGTP